MILTLVGALLVVALLLSFLRLLRGPTLPDRVLSLDLMGLTLIALMVAYAVETGQPASLDVAAVLALLAFLGTVAFATYIERQL